MTNKYIMPNDKAYRIAYLIAGFVRGTLSEPEKDELDDWLTESDEHIALFAELTDERNIDAALKERAAYNSELAIQKLKQKIKIEKPKTTRRRIWQYAAAAIVVVSLALVYQSVVTPSSSKKNEWLQTDYKPAGYSAILTLDNGDKINLTEKDATVALQDEWQINQQNGQLEYSGEPSSAGVHTLSTPSGAQYRVRLPDGSVAWLNAASSISYPTVFEHNNRIVEVTGEVYFEVSKISGRKFVVKTTNSVTEVLGTRFDVNTYREDSSTIITLASGAVKVMDRDSNSVVLKPDSQVKVRSSGIGKVEPIETDEVLSWKNGWFYFKDADIKTIMNEVARWYDVEIVYKDNIHFHFNAEIERSVPASELLRLLEMTDRVHFTLQNRTIIVSQ